MMCCGYLSDNPCDHRIDERSKQHEDPAEQLELRKLRRKLSQVQQAGCVAPLCGQMWTMCGNDDTQHIRFRLDFRDFHQVHEELQGYDELIARFQGSPVT